MPDCEPCEPVVLVPIPANSIPRLAASALTKAVQVSKRCSGSRLNAMPNTSSTIAGSVASAYTLFTKFKKTSEPTTPEMP